MLINPVNLNKEKSPSVKLRTIVELRFDGSKSAQHLTERLSIDLALVTGDRVYTHR